MLTKIKIWRIYDEKDYASKFNLLMIIITLSRVYPQWYSQPTPTNANLFDVHFPSPTNGLVVGSNGTLLKTTDKGNSWTIYPTIIFKNFYDIEFIDSVSGWIAGHDNTFLSTTNGGVSWDFEIDNQPYWSHYYGLEVMHTTSGIKTWAVGGRSFTGLTMILSSKGDGLWNLQNCGYAGRMVDLDFINPNLGWAAGDLGLILKTTNGGKWWNQMESGTNLGFAGIRFFNEKVGLVAGNNGLIKKSTDGGIEWRTVRSGDEAFYKIWIQTDSIAYVVGSNKTILVTKDQGETWTKQTVNAPATNFEDIFFINKNEGWAVGSGGIIVHTTNGGGITSVKQSQDEIPSRFAIHQNYPNPFNPTTVIQFEIPVKTFVTLKIYNQLGQEITTLVNELKLPGIYEVKWDASNVPSGAYYYKINAGEFVETKKLILLR